MSWSDYHFITHWRVLGTVTEVSEVLQNPGDLSRWWPSVYLKTEELSVGDQAGIGRVVRVLTKGWLPYTLSWQLEVVASRRPFGFTIEATGDFVGRGSWLFEQEGAWVDVTFDWRVRVEKPGVRQLSPLLKPLFAANHRWAMRRGQESLIAELERRRAGGTPGRLPPRATTTSPVPLLLAGAAACLALFSLVLLTRGRRSR
jgi:hypothetical protein